MSRITYSDIVAYLDAIADRPGNQGDIDSSSHGRFWKVPYRQLVSGKVPAEDCKGLDIPIVDPDPAKCPLYQALLVPGGWCQLGQMPLNGPFATDPGYTVTLKDGTNLSGRQLIANILWWVTNGMPEM